MSNVDRHEPGTFSWVELSTTDAAAARDFYTSLFGWEVEESPMGDGTFYSMFRRNGRYTAAMYERRSQEIPPHWLSYVTVASADESVAKAQELGATVQAGPFDVFDAGRMAVIRDPTGAALALWQAYSHIGAGVTAEPGTFCWNELATHAAADAAGFYGQLFGWGTRAQQMPEGTYTVFQQGERQAGGMYEPTEEMAGMPIGWHVYFAVEDCDASADLAKELGARLHVPPSDISDVGRFALVQDPQGAMFSILQPAPTTQAQQAEAEAATAAAV